MGTYYAMVCNRCQVCGPSVLREGSAGFGEGPADPRDGIVFLREHGSHVADVLVVSEHDPRYEWPGS